MSQLDRHRFVWQALKLFSILCVAMVCTPSSLANTFTAFGPKTYTRNAGEPVTITDQFTVLNPNTLYTLRVTNSQIARREGDDSGGDDQEVSKAIITINGVRVVDPDDFKDQVSVLNVPIKLLASNQIGVEVRGGRGGTITVQVIGVDNDLPTIKATVSPTPNAAGWNNTNVTVTFVCSDATSGVASCPPPQTLTAEGANQVIQGTAVDNAGNTATATLSLNIDKTPPTIAVSSPVNGSTVSTPLVSITGTVTDNLSGVGKVTCGSVLAVVTVSTFTCTVTLVAGINAIPTQATDVAGNQSTVNFSLTLSSFQISDFNPKFGPVGTLITVTGNGFVPTSGSVPQVALSGQGGGTIAAPLSSFAATTLAFVIPTGAASGPLRVSVAGQTVSSSLPLVVTASSAFTLSAVPSAASLIEGQSVSYAINIGSTTGFSGLAVLKVSGLPASVVATFAPTQITAGQTSVLTVQGSLSSPVGSSVLSVSASATVDGVLLNQTVPLTLNVVQGSTSLVGRSVVDDALETPLSGVTVTMLGKNGEGGTTGCAGSTVSDEAGNFALTGLGPACVGPQLVGYNGVTATSPTGKYAGVNLVYTFQSGQVTSSPVLVHLPRIDNKETFLVHQNAAQDQSYSYKSIPGLSVTVYKGTTFTLADGSQPDPFPLVAVQVPVDRLPDQKPPVPTMLSAFIVAFQPANAVASRPTAVFYPNTLNTPSGSNMPLMTLDPTRGRMIPYGTGTVSSDGTQIVPDPDPAFSGARYGIVHFDWHGAMPLPGNDVNPCKDRCCPQCGDPVDFSSGLLVIRETDISIDGNRGGIAFERTYRNLFNLATSNAADEAFGYGTSHNYRYHLDKSPQQTTDLINLVMPDGNQLPFSKQADGTWTNGTVPRLQGAVMKLVSPGIADLRWKDGTIFRFSGKTFQQFAYASLDSITDPNGNVITLVNTSAGRVTDIVDPVGRRLHLDYDGSGRITQITDPIGRTVTYSYSGILPGVLRVVQYPDGATVRYDYDLANNLTLVTDRRGIAAASSTYDVNGRVIKQVRGDGSVFQFSYKLLNPLVPTSPVLQTTVTDPLGRNSVYRFNPQGFLIDVTDILGQLRDIARDGSNQIVKVQGTAQCSVCTPAQNGDQSYSYDGAGNLTSSTDALGNTTTYTYEPVVNKVTSIKDPLGNKTTFTYDGHGNLLTQTDANGKTTSYNYDGNGLLTQSTDPLGQKTLFGYDSFGNSVKLTDPLGNFTQFRYDGISRLVEVHDSLDRKTITDYDSIGRVVKLTNPLQQVTAFSYDPAGNLLSLTDARGKTTAFSYDPMNRLQTRTDPRGKSDTRKYDPNGNLISFTDRRGQTSAFTYDVLDRLTQEQYSDGSLVKRSYDSNGRLIQADDSAGGTFTFADDVTGHLLASSSPFGSVQYVRDPLERVKHRGVVGQPGVDYSYDPVGNLLGAAMPQASVAYTYDARNQPFLLSRPNGVTSSYSFDPLGRVLSIVHSRGASAVASLGYSYDVSGNRVSEQTSSAQSLITQPATATYDDANRLVQRGSTNFSFDDNGNLISENGPGGMITYTWDSRNRLKSVSAPNGQKTDFVYDFAGNLSSQSDSGPSLNLSRNFVVDGLSNVAFERSSDGDQFSVLTGQFIDSHLATVRSSGQVEYVLTDAINSSIATVDQTGALKGQFSYEPLGETTASGSSYPFRYTGRVPVSSSLYYYRARYYNPATGRFISEDPTGSGGSDANLYRYAQNAPISLRDPYGLQASSVFSPPAISGPGSTVNLPYSPSCPSGQDSHRSCEEEWIQRNYGSLVAKLGVPIFSVGSLRGLGEFGSFKGFTYFLLPQAGKALVEEFGPLAFPFLSFFTTVELLAKLHCSEAQPFQPWADPNSFMLGYGNPQSIFQ